MILIIGTDDDPRTEMVAAELSARQYPFRIFRTSDFPYVVQLSYDIAHPVQGALVFQDDGTRIALRDIQSVYYCTFSSFQALADDPPSVQANALHNIQSAFWSFIHSLDCLIVNPVYPANHHDYKAHILQLLRKKGIRVPDTLVTNDPAAVVAFFEAQNESVIFKPPWGQAFTRQLTREFLQPEHLEKLANSPIMLQEYIPGQDIRAYVIRDEVYATEILSETLDLNADEMARRVAINLPPQAQRLCLEVADATGLIFTGIDLRRTPEGEYVVFEANSSPEFSTDEYWSDYPLRQRLVDLLIQGA